MTGPVDLELKIKKQIEILKECNSWDQILHFIDDPNFVNMMISVYKFPENFVEFWPGIVNKFIDVNRQIITDGYEEHYSFSNEKTSSWQIYRKKLEEKHFSNASIDIIEEECRLIMENLRQATDKDPVKGLVVGNIQSGKTSNMAGLMSMASDAGWNFFIILSGTDENLRIQTASRLSSDLSSDMGVIWQNIEHPNKMSGIRLSDLPFHRDTRYMTVCLKCKDRLQQLIDWLDEGHKKSLKRPNYDNPKTHLKVLLIDDESDQASVNTKKEKRSTINNLIVNLINAFTKDSKEGNQVQSERYEAMNYVCYTATPYANFLSEGIGPGLYPSNFIIFLTPSKSYFGPDQIFGNEELGYPGMDIVNIDGNPELEIVPIHDNESGLLPQGLRDSLSWFICSIAVARYWGIHHPISMLINTDVKTEKQENVARAVSNYLAENKNEIMENCERIYDVETKKFTLEKLRDSFSDYELIDTVKDYPSYSMIKDEIESIIYTDVRHPKYDFDDEIVFNDGINLCLDNSNKKVIIDVEDDKLHPRLIYPDGTYGDAKHPEYPDKAPAFLVIGGYTLSRGLTIKGLVSTYFGRKTTSGDTLMQMGRWFGYRQGYELLPRIWMSDKVYKDIIEMAGVNFSLLNFVKEHYNDVTPADYPPMVKRFPKCGYVNSPTQSSKRRAASIIDYDFTGCLTEPMMYNRKKLVNNNRVVCEFLSKLNDPDMSVPIDKCPDILRAAVWRGISLNDILDLIDNFELFSGSKSYNEMLELKKWIENKNIDSWTVILAGKTDNKTAPFNIGKISVNKIVRSCFMNETNKIQFTQISSPEDRIIDIPKSALEEHMDLTKSISSNWRTIRKVCNVSDKPVLIAYCIDGNPTYAPMPKNSHKKLPDIETDIMALSFILPGLEKNKAFGSAYRINMGD